MPGGRESIMEEGLAAPPRCIVVVGRGPEAERGAYKGGGRAKGVDVLRVGNCVVVVVVVSAAMRARDAGMSDAALGRERCIEKLGRRPFEGEYMVVVVVLCSRAEADRTGLEGVGEVLRPGWVGDRTTALCERMGSFGVFTIGAISERGGRGGAFLLSGFNS